MTIPLWLVFLLAAGCQPAPNPVTDIRVPGRPANPVTVPEFKAAVDADKKLLKTDQAGLDKAETARIQWWLGWIAGGGAALSLAAFALRFYPPAAAFAWLLTPICKYSGLLAAGSFVAIWLVPWRYWIGFGLALLILGYEAVRLLRSRYKISKVAGSLSRLLDIVKRGGYADGMTSTALIADGADLKLAETIRQDAKG